MSRFRNVLAGLGVALCAAAALADNTVIPAANTTVDGSQSTVVPLTSSTLPRTFQFVYGRSLMSGIPVGSQIVGMTFRRDADGSGAYPAATLSYTQYDIQLSSSVNAPGSLSATFASNIGADVVTARSGSISFAANSFPGGAASPAVNAWGPRIPFTTPLVYTGTDLLVTMRVGGTSSTTLGFLDGLAVVAGQQQAMFATGTAAVTATTTTAFSPVVRFDYIPPVEITKAYAPFDNADVAGPSNNYPILNNTAETVQLIVAASELTSIPRGSRINGLSLRCEPAFGAWPNVAATYAQYDVYMSQSQKQVGAMSLTIADNQGPDLTQVRSGALSLAMHAFPNDADAQSRCSFGVTIPFTTPYLYRGGDIHVLIRHSAIAAVQGVVDAVSPGNGRIQCGFTDGNANVTVTNTVNSSCPIVRFSVLASPVVSSVAISSAGGNGFGIMWPGALTYQVIIGAEELTHIKPGGVIDGVSWRRFSDGSAAWPPTTDASFNQFDIQISQSPNSPGAMSDTFANNIGADVVLARSGPLVIPKNAFPGGVDSPDVNAFGPFIAFTAPYVYKGGDITLTVRQSGATGQPTSYCDAVPTIGGEGYGTRFAARWNNGAAAASALEDANALVTRVHATPSVCVPTAFATAHTNAGTSLGLFSTDRTLQVVIDPIELADVPPGSLITGLSVRRSDFLSTQPDGDVTFPNYTIQLSTSPTSPATMSDTFANNIGADVVTVRTGPLTIPALKVHGRTPSPVVNPYWVYIPFNRPFAFDGMGPISITARFTGSGTESIFVESVQTGDPLFGVAVAARSATDAVSPVANGVVPFCPVFRFAYTTFRCPADYDGNGFVNGDDADLFAIEFLAGSPFADFDGNGFVNGDDADFFAIHFLAGC